MEGKSVEVKATESLLESLIKMLGRSNQRVDELYHRVIQLEMYIHESRDSNERNTERLRTFS